MRNRFTDLRRKEVINICDGTRLGCVGDVELQLPEGTATALVVYGPCRFFGLFGRGEEYYIPWDSIRRIGDDIVLIDRHFAPSGDCQCRKKHGWWGGTRL